MKLNIIGCRLAGLPGSVCPDIKSRLDQVGVALLLPTPTNRKYIRVVRDVSCLDVLCLDVSGLDVSGLDVSGLDVYQISVRLWPMHAGPASVQTKPL